MLQLGMIPKTRDMQDPRDLKYSTLLRVNRYAERVMLDVPEILDQGDKGICTAFAMSYATRRIFKERLSENFNYTKTKENDNFPGQEGTTIDATMKAFVKFGSCEYGLLPQDKYVEKLVFPEITKEMEDDAANHKLDVYVKIETIEELTDHLLHGNFAVGGFTVGLQTLFHPEHTANGDAVIDLPQGTVAGHALCIIGKDDNMTWTYQNGTTRKGFVKVANSWGTGESRREFGTDDTVIWSETGCGFIPYDYVFGTMYAPDGSQTPYVNEIYIPLRGIPFNITKIDTYNNNTVPYISNNRIMVPLRFIGETLGADVLYTEHDRGITISKRGLLIKLNTDSDTMQVNNSFIKLDQRPEVKAGRTFVPLRAVAEAFGAGVNWYPNERKVEIRLENTVMELWQGKSEARLIKRV